MGRPALDARYDYQLRRAALRDTWFPHTPAAHAQARRQHGMVFRFVVGRVPEGDEAATLALDLERQQRPLDFMTLDLTVSVL